MHEQKRKEGSSRDERTTPPIAHHSSRFIAAKITSAIEPGPRPLLTTLITPQDKGGDWVEGGAATPSEIT
jgi:hypothetical protein